MVLIKLKKYWYVVVLFMAGAVYFLIKQWLSGRKDQSNGVMMKYLDGLTKAGIEKINRAKDEITVQEIELKKAKEEKRKADEKIDNMDDADLDQFIKRRI